MNWLNFGGRDMRNKGGVAAIGFEMGGMARRGLKGEMKQQSRERYGLLGR